ncbi:MAG: FolC bifunctional protein [Parcubacteria group bacterium GW2011_GWC2_39_14]|nr:MAG: FolC bifunctional protein [Parcubacteria group bacterium GW2011_GWC2_39_14]KKR54932.1 MAG: FolC bifunctional protein [Parcubacteria group bacterium GW2011_GWA2_40_23]
MKTELYAQYLEALNYIDSLGNLKAKDFFTGTKNPRPQLERMKHLLKLAGNPDRGLKIIHITGTSGKGSTTNYIYNILQCAGHKVGAYFSPSVSVPTEKIQINNKFISVSDLIELIEQIKPIVQRCYETLDAPSHFEIWFLIALLYFKKQKCDYVVLEVGCGGRYDATNAVEKTLVSAITNISLDHMHILGNTYTKIAYEKAGIIRLRGKVFTTTESPAALKVIEAEVEKQRADLTILHNQENPNIALASVIAEYLETKPTAIEKGIQQSKLPARFEIIQTNPTVILDGAHNADKITFFFKKLDQFRSKLKTQGQLHVICGLTSQKDARKVFAPLFAKADKVYISRFTTTFRKVTPPLVIKKFCPKNKFTGIFLDPNEALKSALKKAHKNDLIIITGSFFLCGDLRKFWQAEIKQLEQRKNFV